MRGKKLLMTWMLLALLAMVNSGCALIGTALSAGAAYGIYAATNQD